MLSLFKKQRKVSFPIGQYLEVDIHSHVLPGIDDGAPDLETSLRLLQGMARIGFRSVVTTPHIISDLYPNNPGSIQAAYDALSRAAGIPSGMTLRYAAEYMLDEGFRVGEDESPLLSLGDSAYVLLETPFLQASIGFEAQLFEIQNKGYLPVLAHPERYHYLFGKPQRYEDLKNRGCRFQVNLLSLKGYYGIKERDAARWLLEADMVDFLATDLHHDRHLQSLMDFTLDRKIVQLLERRDFLNSTLQLGINKT